MIIMLNNTTNRQDFNDSSPHGEAARLVAMVSVGNTKHPTAANLSIALARRGKHVCLITTSTPSGNNPLRSGQNRKSPLGELLTGQKLLAEVLSEGPSGTHVLPAENVFASFFHLEEAEQRVLVELLTELEEEFDYIIVEAVSEAEKSLLQICQAAPLILMSITPDADSLTSAFSLLQALKRQYKDQPIHIIVEMAENLPRAHDTFKKIRHAASKYLQMEPHYLGHLPFPQPPQIERNLAAASFHPDSLNGGQLDAIADRFCTIADMITPLTSLSHHFGELCSKQKILEESADTASVPGIKKAESTKIPALSTHHNPAGWHVRLSDRMALYDAVHYASMLGEKEKQK